MPVSVLCPCGKRYNVPDNLAGRRFACRACGTALRAKAEVEVLDEPELIDDDDDKPLPSRAPAPARPAALPLAPARKPQPAPDYRPPAVIDPRPPLSVSTWASNPGRMALSFPAYLAAYPPYYAIAATLIGLGGLFYHWSWALVVCAGPVVLLRDFFHEMTKFRIGDVNPAVVISQRPLRVAAYADLSTGRAAKPAIRVFSPRGAAFPEGAPPVGTPLAVVCLYYGRADHDSWADVLPTIVQCAGQDPATVEAVMASVADREWQALEHYLPQLDRPRPGIHKLWLGGKWFSTGGTSKLADALGPIVVAVTIAIVLPIALNKSSADGRKRTGAETVVPSLKIV